MTIVTLGATRRNGHHLSASERKFLGHMLASLGFRYLERPLVGFQQTTETYARYELLRQTGLGWRQALDQLFYNNRYYSTYLGQGS